MNENNKDIVDQYIKLSRDTRNQLTALSVVLLGAVYVFSQSESNTFNDIITMKLSVLLLFITIFLEVFSGFFRRKHYILWFENKIENIDVKNSIWGKISDYLFNLSFITITAGIVLFGFSLF